MQNPGDNMLHKRQFPFHNDKSRHAEDIAKTRRIGGLSRGLLPTPHIIRQRSTRTYLKKYTYLTP